MVITHLEPDILECEVKRALGRIPTNKANGGDEIPADVFQILKDKKKKLQRNSVWILQMTSSMLAYTKPEFCNLRNS